MEYSHIVRFMLGDYADEFLALQRPYEPISRRVPAHYNPAPNFGLRLAVRRRTRTPLPHSKWRVVWGTED